MRVTGITIEAFGQIQDTEFPDLDSPIVCVAGPNEAGKTTIRQFVGAMLFGIYPVDPAVNPWVPHDGRYLQGRLMYQLASGERGEVIRRLRASPEGEWRRGDGLFTHADPLRNQTLPVVDHVSRRVFESVYTLSLDDLTAFKGRTLGEVRERLLGGLNAPHIRAAAEVAEELDGEAVKLWRSDRRGKPKSALLAERKRELREELRRSREAAAEIRRLNGELSEIGSGVGDRRVQLDELLIRSTRARARRTRAVRLRELEGLLDVARLADGLDDLPADCAGYLRSRRDEANAVGAEIRETRSSLELIERAMVAELEENEFLVRDGELDRALQNLDEAIRARSLAASARHRLEQDSAAFLAGLGFGYGESDGRESPSPIIGEIAAKSPEAFLDLSRRAAAVESLLEGARNDHRRAAERFHGAFLVVVVAASCMLAGWVLGAAPFLLVVLAALAIVSAALSAAQRGRMRRVERTRADLLAEGRELERARAELFAPIGGVIRQRGDDQLLEVLRTGRELASTAEALARLDADVLSVARSVAVTIERADAGAEPLVVSTLDDAFFTRRRAARMLEEAQQRLDRRAADAKELVRLDSRLEVLKQRHDEQIVGLADVESRLLEAGGGVLSRGLAALQKARAARARAVELEQELAAEETPASGDVHHHPDSRHGSEDPDELEAQVERVQAEIERLTDRAQGVREDLARLEAHRPVDRVTGDLDVLGVEIAELLRDHDRLRLLEGIVRFADERFRERHQPDVLARANRYLRRITDGRYVGIDVADRTGEIAVARSGGTVPRPLETSVSQGTRDQVYLSLRLALADHLDEGREAIPLFLDELFVTWDADRRTRAYSILEEISERRQVFVMTCHEGFSREIAGALGARVLRVLATPSLA